MNLTIEKKEDFYTSFDDNEKRPIIRFEPFEKGYLGYYHPKAFVYPEGTFENKDPFTEVDLFFMTRFPVNWFKDRLAKDPLTKRSNFPGLSSSQYSRFIEKFLKWDLPEKLGDETMLQPYADLLINFGFRKSDREDQYIYDEVLDDEIIKDILNGIVNLAETEVWPEVYDTLIDAMAIYLKEESDKKASERQAREETKNIQANGYIVHDSFRNGFLDCDRKATKVNSLDEIRPENVSWLRVGDELHIPNGDEVQNMKNSNVAHIINEGVDNTWGKYQHIWIPIIKAKKIVNGEEIGPNVSYTYDTSANKWITLAEAKSRSKGAINGVRKYADSSYWDVLEGKNDVVSKDI